jgi:hypothetical protein
MGIRSLLTRMCLPYQVIVQQSDTKTLKSKRAKLSESNTGEARSLKIRSDRVRDSLLLLV